MSQPRTPIRVSKASMVAVAFTAILSCTAAVAPFMAQAAEGKTIVVAEFRDVSPILVGNDVKLTGVQVGKVAAMRGLPVQTLAFPTSAIPQNARTAPVELPVVYAVARQESSFNVAAVSSAGARGLLQLMPATAKKAASVAGLPFSEPRLTQDAAYNATLGAEHLGELFDGFGGSYVMTFASYNAGRSRILDWVKAHGDPRDPKVDVVDWIELIPFTETRIYVQRVMQNLQDYRDRLNTQPSDRCAVAALNSRAS